MNACFINRSHNIERVIIVEKSSVRYFMAIAFIGFGAMLVLDNFGVLESDIKELWHYVYPAFFIVFGFSLITRYFKYKGSSWIFGLFFIVFGGALILGDRKSTRLNSSHVANAYAVFFLKKKNMKIL